MLYFKNIYSFIALLSMISPSCYAGKLEDALANRDIEDLKKRAMRYLNKSETCPPEKKKLYQGKFRKVMTAVTSPNNFGGSHAERNEDETDKNAQHTLGNKRKASVLVESTATNSFLQKNNTASKKQKTSQSVSVADLMQSNVEISTSPLSPQINPQTVSEPKIQTQKEKKKRHPRTKRVKRVEQMTALLKDGKSVQEVAELLGITERGVLNLRSKAKKEGLLVDTDMKTIYNKPLGINAKPIHITPSIQEVADLFNAGNTMEEVVNLTGKKSSRVSNLRAQAKRLGLLNDIEACYQNKIQN